MNGLRYNIFFCGSRILQLFCHKAKAANAILSIAKNNWNENFSDFIELQAKNRSCLILCNWWLYTLQLHIVGNFLIVVISRQ